MEEKRAPPEKPLLVLMWQEERDIGKKGAPMPKEKTVQRLFILRNAHRSKGLGWAGKKRLLRWPAVKKHEEGKSSSKERVTTK